MQPAPRGVTGFFSDPLAHATMMAHVNVQVRMQAAGAPAGAVPADTYLEDRRRKFHNGDAIEFFYQPNAVTDGDSLVHFRRADVIVAGDIFTTTQYPVIDVKNGGSVQGRDQGAERDPRTGRCTGTRARAAPTSCRATAISPTSTRWSSTATWSSSSAIG